MVVTAKSSSQADAAALAEVIQKTDAKDAPCEISIREVLQDGVKVATADSTVEITGEVTEEGQKVVRGGAEPKFIVLPMPVYINVGERISLRCRVSG